MGIATRVYLFPEDGSLRRVPQRLADALPFGRDAIPEFAGTRQRVLLAVVESRDGKPTRILDARGIYWLFDVEGRIDHDLRTRWAEHLDAGITASRTKRGPVIDLVPEIKKRELDARDRWSLSADDLDKIAADLWPGIHGPAPAVESVRGATQRKPPLTQAGRWALERIQAGVSTISAELSGLSERALKGLAFEALRMGTLEEEALWRGVAGEAERIALIRAAERTGRGEWIAVVDVTRRDRDDPVVLERVTSAHVRCASRKEAIAAGRKLMAEKVEWLDADTIVKVTLVSALDWHANA